MYSGKNPFSLKISTSGRRTVANPSNHTSIVSTTSNASTPRLKLSGLCEDYHEISRRVREFKAFVYDRDNLGIPVIQAISMIVFISNLEDTLNGIRRELKAAGHLID
jgi:hypothetical protein